jgi:hypothetical protein
MRHIKTTISGHRGAFDAEAVLFWIFAGIILVIAFGDALTVLAVALAIIAAISWIIGKVEHRMETSDPALAPVTHLRAELTGHAELGRPSRAA